MTNICFKYLELGPGQWSCPSCTLANDQSVTQCVVCETPRVEDDWCLTGAAGKKQRKVGFAHV
jgi:hypothetical protein